MNPKKYYKLLNIPLVEEADTKIIALGCFTILFSITIIISDLPKQLSVILLLIRIFSFFYAIHKAELLNRNKFFWGILSLITPSIALITIGLLHFNIDIKPLKTLVKNHRDEYQKKVSNLNLINNTDTKLASEIYLEHNEKLKASIKNKLDELTIYPQKTASIEMNEHSNITVIIGSYIFFLLSFGKRSIGSIKDDKNIANNARVGHIFYLVILIIIIVIIINLLRKSSG